MTLPANVRVNVGAPFPALVQGSGLVTVSKSNGIWTLGFSIAGLGIQVPPVGSLPTDYVIAYDAVAKAWFLVSLATLLARTQRSITAGPVAIATNDRILNLNLGSSLTITLPGYATRFGVGLTFKDVGKQATANPITIAAAAGETIDGNASVPLNTNGQSIALVPANDGVNTGWFQE